MKRRACHWLNRHRRVAGWLARGFMAGSEACRLTPRLLRRRDGWWLPAWRLQQWCLNTAQFFSVFTDWPGRAYDRWGVREDRA